MAVIEKINKKLGDYLQIADLEIPKYQRPYKWQTKNVNQLIGDIQKFKEKASIPYRIGTVVIYQEKENGKYEIVDGQQRTITFILLFIAIYQNKTNFKSAALKNKIELINETISENKLNPKFTNTISQRNIQLNYLEIERKIIDIDESFIEYFLNQCEVTFFVINDISEAFQFFDAQNARGKDLEPHDLLKAFHLRELNETDEDLSAKEIEKLVDVWENMETNELASLFADFLFRVRGWSKGNSSRYFLKRHTNLFKGINLSKINNYPFTHIFRLVDLQLKQNIKEEFPFQLDQTIINGKYFFKMITHYKLIFDDLVKVSDKLEGTAKEIMDTLDGKGTKENNYTGKYRTGDKYIRMLFDCALLYYVDKFGKKYIEKAIEKIFIWAYTLRLRHHSIQLASVDNYVCDEINIFKEIKNAIHTSEITTIQLPILTNDHKSDKVTGVKELFITMKYCTADAK